jgi:hypothetical protein
MKTSKLLGINKVRWMVVMVDAGGKVTWADFFAKHSNNGASGPVDVEQL